MLICHSWTSTKVGRVIRGTPMAMQASGIRGFRELLAGVSWVTTVPPRDAAGGAGRCDAPIPAPMHPHPSPSTAPA